MLGETIYLLPAAFFIALLIVFLIYRVGGKLSARGKPESSTEVDLDWRRRYFWPAKGELERPDDKTASYACGEDMPTEECRVDLERFFVYTVYFLIFDVLVFILATSFNVTGLNPIIYCTTLLMSVAMFLYVRGYA